MNREVADNVRQEISTNQRQVNPGLRARKRTLALVAMMFAFLAVLVVPAGAQPAGAWEIKAVPQPAVNGIVTVEYVLEAPAGSPGLVAVELEAAWDATRFAATGAEVPDGSVNASTPGNIVLGSYFREDPFDTAGPKWFGDGDRLASITFDNRQQGHVINDVAITMLHAFTYGDEIDVAAQVVVPNAAPAGPELFTITNERYQTMLAEQDGGAVRLATAGDVEWEIRDIGNGQVHIINAATGNWIDGDGYRRLLDTSTSPAEDDVWTMKELSNGNWVITNAKHNVNMDADRNNIVGLRRDEQRDAQWILTSVSGGAPDPTAPSSTPTTASTSTPLPTAPSSTPTAAPTSTPVPTATSAPTSTPLPTATTAPTSTATPFPTATTAPAPGGTAFHIENERYGTRLAEQGGQTIRLAISGNTVWNIVDIGNGEVHIINAATGNWIDGDGYRRLLDTSTSPADDDVWTLKELDSGNWVITNAKHNVNMDADGNNIVGMRRDEQRDAQWRLIPVDSTAGAVPVTVTAPGSGFDMSVLRLPALAVLAAAILLMTLSHGQLGLRPRLTRQILPSGLPASGRIAASDRRRPWAIALIAAVLASVTITIASPASAQAAAVRGDVNCTSAWDIADAYTIARASVRLDEPALGCDPAGNLPRGQYNALEADANCDGNINILDAYSTARAVVGLDGGELAICAAAPSIDEITASVESSTVQLNWQAEPTTRDVVYEISREGTVVTRGISANSSTSIEATGTAEYCARLVPIPSGDEIRRCFFVDADAGVQLPAPPALDWHVVRVGGDEILVQWSRIEDSIVPVEGYGVFVNGALYDDVWMGVSADERLISGLNPATDYAIGVYPAIGSAFHVGTFDNDLTVRTHTGLTPPTQPVLTEQNLARTHNSIEVTWGYTAGASADDTDVTQYVLRLNGDPYVVSGDVRNHTFFGLRPSTAYSVSVTAYDEDGQSATSPTISATTLANPPAPPEIIGVDTAIDDTPPQWTLNSPNAIKVFDQIVPGQVRIEWCCALDWGTTDYANFDITPAEFDVYFGTTSSGSLTNRRTIGAAGSGGTFLFENLPENVDYTVAIVAVDRAGNRSKALVRDGVAAKPGPTAGPETPPSTGGVSEDPESWRNPVIPPEQAFLGPDAGLICPANFELEVVTGYWNAVKFRVSPDGLSNRSGTDQSIPFAWVIRQRVTTSVEPFVSWRTVHTFEGDGDNGLGGPRTEPYEFVVRNIAPWEVQVFEVAMVSTPPTGSTFDTVSRLDWGETPCTVRTVMTPADTLPAVGEKVCATFERSGESDIDNACNTYFNRAATDGFLNTALIAERNYTVWDDDLGTIAVGAGCAYLGIVTGPWVAATIALACFGASANGAVREAEARAVRSDLTIRATSTCAIETWEYQRQGLLGPFDAAPIIGVSSLDRQKPIDELVHQYNPVCDAPTAYPLGANGVPIVTSPYNWIQQNYCSQHPSHYWRDQNGVVVPGFDCRN